MCALWGADDVVATADEEVVDDDGGDGNERS